MKANAQPTRCSPFRFAETAAQVYRRLQWKVHLLYGMRL